MPQADLPVIPETIVVHLGTPNSNARNVTVSFPDYIKNVASCEIYPTWPENALRANLYVQITYALNRVYTEWYRSQGYNFDITNSTQYDQAYIHGRDIFENISRLVDELFNDYVTRRGSIEPYFTQFCNGTTVTCAGLSQWGTVTLANRGYTPYQILTYYYGEDLDIVRNAPIQSTIPSYPGVSLRLGSTGNEVLELQIQLNRIGNNYPAIPKITPVNAVFGVSTERAVRTFQSLFGLTVDGIVGQATWYRIKFFYNAVKRLGELSSEGLALEEVTLPFPRVLRQGDYGRYIYILQYYLNTIAEFNNSLRQIPYDGVFGERTEDAVRDFQEEYGLSVDGVVGRYTWQKMQEAYNGILRNLPAGYHTQRAKLFPNQVLSRGISNQNVQDLQIYLQLIGRTYTNIPEIRVTGIYDSQTENVVRAFQRAFGLQVTGIVNADTWAAIAQEYDVLRFT